MKTFLCFLLFVSIFCVETTSLKAISPLEEEVYVFHEPPEIDFDSEFSSWMDLLRYLRKIFGSTGQTKMACEAVVLCMANEVIGGQCPDSGIYLTADQAYFDFKNSDCCARENKGGPVDIQKWSCR